MKFYTIKIDEEVYAFLQSKATAPFEDTPNSVLRRLLKIESGRKRAKIELPREMPVALQQILEVYRYVNSGYLRAEATVIVARERGVFRETVADKYTRQLSKTADEIDWLMRKENRDQFREILIKKFHGQEGNIVRFFSTLDEQRKK